MANIERRGSRTPRRAREQRAYRLVVAGSVFTLIGVVGIVLALLGVIGAGIPVVALVLAGACAFGFRRVVG